MNCNCIRQAEQNLEKKYGVTSRLASVSFPLTEDMVPDDRVTVTFLVGRKKVNVAVPFCPFCGKAATTLEVTSSYGDR